jgi:ankyrin repeat protein
VSDSEDFWFAIQAGELDEVKRLLVDDPALLHAQAPSGHSAVRMACDCGQRELAEALVALGAGLDAFDACAFGDGDKVLALLSDAPELLAAQSRDGWTLLHLACFYANHDLVAALLERGANLNAVSANPTRNTPLHAALAGGAGENTVRLLLERGSDVNAVAGASATPLHLAASRGDSACAELLLAAGAVSRVMDNGQKPAELARDRGFPELADRLEKP